MTARPSHRASLPADQPPALQVLPYATADLEGCGGRLRGLVDDFMVEEQPLYSPSGQGEHLFLWVEKRNRGSEQTAAQLARELGVPRRAVGFAGRKDNRALTRQWFSVHTPLHPTPQAFASAGIRVLETARHGNKLRRGHLAGNRFSILIRGIRKTPGLESLLERLAVAGFPNYFGPQRLGEDGHNAAAGLRLLLSGTAPRQGAEDARFLINAAQSALFNRIVAKRLHHTGDLRQILTGDLAVLERNGACFLVAHNALIEARQRAENGEIAPSAPLFGTKCPLAEGLPGSWEREALAWNGLSPSAFRLGGKRLSFRGERRAVVARPLALQWERQSLDGEHCLRLDFQLAKGVYATSLLRELMKNDTLADVRLSGVETEAPGDGMAVGAPP